MKVKVGIARVKIGKNKAGEESYVEDEFWCIHMNDGRKHSKTTSFDTFVDPFKSGDSVGIEITPEG